MKPQNILITVLVVLLVVSQIKLWFGDYGVVRLAALKKELAKQVDENNRLIKRNESLHAQVKELREGKEALEERARNQLGMIKEGEVFIQEKRLDESSQDSDK